MQNHLSPSNQRYTYRSPSQNRNLHDAPDYYLGSQLSPRQPAVSPAPKREEDHPVTLKLMTMKEMVMRLLVQTPENKSVDELLGEVLSHLKIMMGCVAKRSSKSEVISSRQENDLWSQENSRLGVTLTQLKEISKSKETRETLAALERLRDKIQCMDESRLSPPAKLDRNHFIRRSQIFEQKKFQPSRDQVEAELKELKMEMAMLRKEKVYLMTELNKQIDISNKKSEEIKMLNSLLNRKGIKGGRSDSPVRMNVDRCRSNPKQTANPTSSGNSMQRQQQQMLLIKQKQITFLLNQNRQLRAQLKQSKELPFTQSFLSDAFNVKEQIISSNKQQYERTINSLKSHIFELQNKVDSAKYSTQAEDKRISFEQTSEGRSLKDKSAQGGKLQPRITDLQLIIKREQLLKGSLQKEVEFLRAQEKSMSLEITYLKNEVNRLKSPIVSVHPSQQEMGKSPDRLTSTGVKFRRN